MRKYSIAAEHPDTETEVLIFYTFTPGCPECGPIYASGGEPAEPAEVEFDSVTLLTGKPAPEFDGWAREYLQGDGFDHAVEEAADQSQPDPDDARDRDQDDRMMGVGRYVPVPDGDW